jgi:hypothetical protein
LTHAVLRAANALADGDESVTTPLDTPVSGNLLLNALPPVGTTASVTSFTLPGTTTIIPAGSSPVSIMDPATGMLTGTLAVQPNGTFTFTPATGYDGPVPPVSYVVTSSDGKTDASLLTITITPALSDDDEVRSTRAGTPVTLNLLDNDVPPTGTTTAIATFTLPGSTTVYLPGPTPVPVIDPATGTSTGTIVVMPDGTTTYTPAPGFTGTVPTVSYVVRSSDGQTDPSTLIITVVAGEALPCARGMGTEPTGRCAALKGHVHASV